MVVCSFVLFLLVIVLSVLLQYTDYNCPFGIFKLFFFLTMWKDQFKQSHGYRRRANTNVNNLNRTPYATVRTYALHQVEYIIVHQRHLIVLVNKINRNTTQCEQFHNSTIDLVLYSFYFFR